MPTIHLGIHGRVQGVGYRWYVRETARRTGLAGWVKNLVDGSVEVAASGPEPAINALLKALRVGPPGARVDRVEELEAESLGELPNPFALVKSR